MLQYIFIPMKLLMKKSMLSLVYISSSKEYTAELVSSYDLEQCYVKQLRSNSPHNIFTIEILKELQLQLRSLTRV